MTITIRVFDLEATGFEAPEHVPIEIGWCDLHAQQIDMMNGPLSWIVGHCDGSLVAPGRPVPPDSSAIHHLVDEDLIGAPAWGDASRRALADDGSNRIAYAAHNMKMERQWLTPDLTGTQPWICTWKCSLRLWPDAPAHSNQALRYWKRPAGLDRVLAGNGHRARQDAYVTAFLLAEMLTEASVEQLVKFSTEPALLMRVPFGRDRGKRWSEVDEGLLHWVLGKDFDEDVMFTVRHELKRRADAQAPYDAGPGEVRAAP